MKIWAPNTVAAYSRLVRTLLLKYHALSSDAPQYLVDFMHHDFGYRGVSSEESARVLGAAGLSSGFKGTDTLGAIKLAEKYYDEPMAGFSVIASEHSVMCSYGGKHKEAEAYRRIIQRVKEKCANVNPLSGVIILSLVSDTYNIYNVSSKIIPQLASEFIGWKNNFGIPIKIVIRPDSGTPEHVLFGMTSENSNDEEFLELCGKLTEDMKIRKEEASHLLEIGVFGILLEKFEYSTNSKDKKVLHPQIGVLQGDGVSYQSIKAMLPIMVDNLNLDSMNLVWGSGGKYLQVHDRDEQKYAIKATHIITNGVGVAIEKSPITDAGKKSKIGYMKLIRTGPTWRDFKTLQAHELGFDEAKDELLTVFLNGHLVKEYTFAEVRANSAILESEYID
jgi:nicotinamide phosphoribosyltransferase